MIREPCKCNRLAGAGEVQCRSQKKLTSYRKLYQYFALKVVLFIVILAYIVDNRYLDSIDSHFLDLVYADIEEFLTAVDITNCVLIFPAVLSRYRFLIHQTVEEYPELASFSIGQGDERRTVVCPKHLRPIDSSQPENPRKRGLEGESQVGPDSATWRRSEETKKTRADSSWGLFGRERSESKKTEANGQEKMQSSQDAVNSEGGASSQSKETSRKSKRAPQELYVPRARRQNAPSGESMAACSNEQAVDRPGGVPSESRQQPRRNEKRKGRDSGKMQRDRKISTNGEEGEDNTAKEKKPQNRGRHGRRMEQQRYVPRPQREEAKARKSSDEAVSLPAGGSQSVSRMGDSSATKQVSLTAQSSENASPVPEDWNEIDYDDKEVTCHPTGTRLTAHGRLVPVDPGDTTLQEAAPTEMEVETQDVNNQSEDSMRLEEPYVHTISNWPKEDNLDTTVSNNSDVTPGSHAVESEETTEPQVANSGQKSDNEEEILCLEATEAIETICKTNEDNKALKVTEPQAEISPVTTTTEVSQSQDVDSRVSANTNAVDSLSLNHRFPGENSCLSNTRSTNDTDLTGTRGTSQSSSTTLLPGDADVSETTQCDEQLEADATDVLDAAEACNEEAVSLEAPPDVGKSSDAGNENADEEEAEDDWDAMFDESGDCLKQEEMQELSEGIGKVEVSVKHSKRDYYNYQPKDNMNFSELEHVIEVYDFPADFKSHDLITGFCNMKTKEMDIKWIDDTHALAVFPSSVVAQDALSISNPMFRTRPLILASREAKLKAKHSVELLSLSSKPRPETSAATARRLVSGALGLKTNVSKEQKAAERQKIKEAKDRRRNDKRHQEDIWSGSI